MKMLKNMLHIFCSILITISNILNKNYSKAQTIEHDLLLENKITNDIHIN